MCENRFCAHIRQKWIDLRKTKTKMITGSFYTCLRKHFIRENASFCDNL